MAQPLPRRSSLGATRVRRLLERVIQFACQRIKRLTLLQHLVVSFLDSVEAVDLHFDLGNASRIASSNCFAVGNLPRSRVGKAPIDW